MSTCTVAVTKVQKMVEVEERVYTLTLTEEERQALVDELEAVNRADMVARQGAERGGRTEDLAYGIYTKLVKP